MAQNGNTEINTVWERIPITTDETSSIYEVGYANKLEYHIRVHTAGSGGTITMEHSAIKEPNSFAPVGTARNLNSATNYTEGLDHFLPYVRFKTSSAAGSPNISVFLVVRA
jgi:hypothetical protein